MYVYEGTRRPEQLQLAVRVRVVIGEHLTDEIGTPDPK